LFAWFLAPILYPCLRIRTRPALPRGTRRAAVRRRRLERGLEHLGHPLDEHERDVASQLPATLLGVALVHRGRDHGRDPVALRRERLLLEAADRQHLAG